MNNEEEAVLAVKEATYGILEKIQAEVGLSVFDSIGGNILSDFSNVINVTKHLESINNILKVNDIGKIFNDLSAPYILSSHLSEENGIIAIYANDSFRKKLIDLPNDKRLNFYIENDNSVLNLIQRDINGFDKDSFNLTLINETLENYKNTKYYSSAIMGYTILDKLVSKGNKKEFLQIGKKNLEFIKKNVNNELDDLSIYENIVLRAIPHFYETKNLNSRNHMIHNPIESIYYRGYALLLIHLNINLLSILDDVKETPNKITY